MDAIQNIMERVSVRQFSDKEISEENLRIILEAGMAGPSCKNTRDWSFVVVRDKDMLNKMADANGPPATPLRNAQLGILVCGGEIFDYYLASLFVIDLFRFSKT